MTKEIGLEMNMASTLMINTITASLSFSSHSRSHGPHSQPYYTHHCHHHYGRHRSCRSLAPVAVASSATHEIGNSTKTPCRSTPLQKMQARTDSFSMPPEKLAIFKSLDEWVKQNILVLLQPVEKCWQPYDFLPKPESEGFYEQVKELRERCMELSNEYFVVLVGDMISEETLPSYQTLFNAMDGVGDETGSSPSSWATWNRSWSAEENRHGDLLNDYLYLSGRVDMKQIQKTIQYMIRSGWDPKIDKNPYNGYIYASFQERATFISHGNTARLAKQKGDMKLAQLCGTIAADEKRHEIAYSRIVKKFFEMDPDYAVLALANMMKKKIKMPSHLMYDGQDDKLFESYSAIAQWLGVYTTKDYMNILEHFLGFWKVETLTDGLSGEGRRARDYLCGLPPKFRRLEERAQDKAKKQLYAAHGSTTRFSWIFGKQVNL